MAFSSFIIDPRSLMPFTLSRKTHWRLLKISYNYIPKYIFLPKYFFFLFRSMFSYFYSFYISLFHFCAYHDLLYYFSFPKYQGMISQSFVMQCSFSIQNIYLLLHGIRVACTCAPLVFYIVHCFPSIFVDICSTSDLFAFIGDHFTLSSCCPCWPSFSFMLSSILSIILWLFDEKMSETSDILYSVSWIIDLALPIIWLTI